VLEEGKAFELGTCRAPTASPERAATQSAMPGQTPTDYEIAGHRWHIDCFRCNTCGTLLDSDANLLLLGDGSLICNSCTYSCSACGNKIEDLAILTGDQAYCAGCFRCRNCKKKIENLRYARTSQGMFCMDCHDALMARRRKKSTKSHRAKSGQNNAMLLDKSLPSLPPAAVSQSAFSPDQETLSDAYSEFTPIELPGSTPRHSQSGKIDPPPVVFSNQDDRPFRQHARPRREEMLITIRREHRPRATTRSPPQWHVTSG
jgi:LIM domain